MPVAKGEDPSNTLDTSQSSGPRSNPASAFPQRFPFLNVFHGFLGETYLCVLCCPGLPVAVSCGL